MKKKVLSMILAFAMIMVQIPASVYVLAADRDSGIDSAVVDSANSSTGWTIDDVLDLIDALPQADEVADESKAEVKIALNEALAAYSAAMEQDNIDAEELRNAVGDERRDKLRALSELLSDVEIPVLDSGIDAQLQADFKMGRLSLMGQMMLRGSSPTGAVIGSAENPFLIGTPEVLAELGELTQNNEDYGTDMLFAAANYKLVADIDLAGVDGIQRIKDFKGTFDGDGHAVKNMKTAGLFATAEAGSVIKNLGIENCKISCQDNTGGVAASTDGTIMNCYATGTITGTITGKDYLVGGVVGRTTGTVTNCYVTGNVSGGSTVGGVVGWTIMTTMSTVTNCAALGQTVTGSSYVGRVVGCNGGSTISGCYAFSGMKIGKSGSEATVTGGAANNGKGADLSYDASNAEGAKLSAQFENIFGSDAAWGYTVDALPTLNDMSGDQISELPDWVMLGAGTEENPCIISTAAQLNDLRKVVNDGASSTYGYTNAADRFYKLNANINLSGFNDDGDSTNGNWTPIGKIGAEFLGNFDGNGYAVKQMTIQLPSTYNPTGLFGITAGGSVIKNLGVENCIVTGQYYTGGVVGFAYGTVTGFYFTGTISGNNDTGGVVGLSNYTGSVKRCYSSASVNGNERVGGVAGYSMNPVTACYASGSVTGSTSVGGVVGDAYSATSCVALGKTVTGNSASTGRVVGSYGFSPTNCNAWRYMKIGESGSTAVVTDGAANNDNGADLLYITGQGLLLGDESFAWPVFAENGWDVPENQTSLPKLPYQASYPSIPTKLVQVFTLKLNYNNGTEDSKKLYSEYGEVTLPGKSSLPAMTVSDAKVFVGWDAQQSIDADAAPSYQAGDKYSLTKDTALYAQWKTVSATLDGKDADTGYYEVASCFNTPLQNQTTLTLAHNMFKAAENLDIKGWFQYPPDWLTITLTAEEGSDTATITFGGTSDSTSSNLYEPINVHTSALTLPMGVERFTSDMVHVSIYKAKPTVTWAAAEQNVTYTALEPIITAPTVTLSGTDVFSGSFEYSYKSDASGTVYTNGLPTAVGTYYVKAHIDADYYTNYSGSDSDTDLTLTIAYLQTDAVVVVDGTQGANGWYTGGVTLKAPEGYYIAGSNGSDASWASSLTTISSDTNGDYIYYLQKGSSGEITDAKTIAVNWDTAAPVIGTVTYSVHQSFLDWIFHKSVIRVTVPVTDMTSCSDHISYVLVPDGGTPLAAQTVTVDSDGNAIFDIDKIFKGNCCRHSI